MICNNISHKPKCRAKEAHFSLALSRALKLELHDERVGRGYGDGTQESQEGFKGTQILPTALWTPSRGLPRSRWECPTHRPPQAHSHPSTLCTLPTYPPPCSRLPVCSPNGSCESDFWQMASENVQKAARI